jgi:Ca2+-binding RTX toxin-like protein
LILRKSSDAEVELGGGPFAPGATSEPDSSSEIEMAVGGTGALFLNGGPNPDRFRYLLDEGASGLNLNAGPGDDDVDLISPGRGFIELYVDGGRGADTIEVVGHPEIEVAAFGGPGNDTLYSRHGEGVEGALLDGGSGNDRIIGGPGDEGVFPGSGRDTVRANAGSDLIFSRRDRRKDRFDCGPGTDYVVSSSPGHRHESPVDPFDSLRSCRRVG